MKSILIVTEQFTMGGLETHIQGGISKLAKAGWEIHLAVGKNFNPELLPEYILSVTNGLPIEPTNTTADLVNTVEELRKIIREKSINYVHAHPFLSIIPAIISAELEGIPFALTLHGPASLASYGPIYDFLFKEVVLPTTDLLIAISPEVKRYASIYTPEQSIAYIPNAVKFTDILKVTENDAKKELGWLVVSRLDELKIIGILDFIVKAKQAGISRVVIVGDGPAKESLNQNIISRGLSNYVHFHGVSTDVYSLIKRSSGVAGMGRAALEGLACKKPVVLVGYDGVKGVLNQHLFELAIDSNFSGRGLSTIDEFIFTQQVENIATDEILSLYDFAESRFNEDHVWQLFENHLVKIQPRTPGVLTNFYYSIQNDLTEDLQPYLHSSKVLEHLGDLVISLKYFTPRLSNAYAHYKQRFIDLSIYQSLAEKNAQIASLSQAVTERNVQIASLNEAMIESDKKIQTFITSRSWRITRPFRVIFRLFLSWISKKG